MIDEAALSDFERTVGMALPKVTAALGCSKLEAQRIMIAAGAWRLGGLKNGPLVVKAESLREFLTGDLAGLRVTEQDLIDEDRVVYLHRGEFVYLVQCNEGPIKIGYTRNHKQRMDSLRLANPYPLKLLAMFHGGKWLEFALHARFAAHRIHGEWFRPTEMLLKLAGGS